MLLKLKTLFAVVCLCCLAASPLLAQDKATDKKSASKSKTTKKASSSNVRTLEDITIEGEIAVPQVLFITSRDYRRYRDGLGLKFQMNTSQVARTIDLPTRLRIVALETKEEVK